MFWVIVTIIQVLGKYMIIGYMDPKNPTERERRETMITISQTHSICQQRILHLKGRDGGIWG